MGKREVCPYCGSNDIFWSGWPENCYYCTDCWKDFFEEDAMYEDVRHELSALIMDTDEQHPLKCEITIGNREAQGLSTLEMPVIIGIFHDFDACIWFNVYGVDEPMEFDDFMYDDVLKILNEIKSNYGKAN